MLSECRNGRQVLEKGVFDTVWWNIMVNIARPSQWNGCHSWTCMSTAVPWRYNSGVQHQTEFALARFTLKSSLLYIKYHVSEIHLDSYTFFYFFPRAVSYSQIIYKWVGGMSASQDVPEHRKSTLIDTLALARLQFSLVKWVTVSVIMLNHTTSHVNFLLVLGLCANFECEMQRHSKK